MYLLEMTLCDCWAGVTLVMKVAALLIMVISCFAVFIALMVLCHPNHIDVILGSLILFASMKIVPCHPKIRNWHLVFLGVGY
jgi:hypothetical protein